MNKNYRILIIEDEIILQDVYKLVLSLQGYQVYTANNGAAGLIMVKKHKPDVILLDIFMPVMDGLEFMKNINLKDYPKSKIIVYTNLTDSTTEEKVLRLGASKYVLKSSMKPQDLIDMVTECLTNQETDKIS
ncbi:MAG: response regulator [Candidatus Saccharimonadales bacterium]